MSTMLHAGESGLLHAISTSPNDTAPRLVYTDFLEDAGDERAAFVRLHCQLEALPVWHPERYPLLDALKPMRARLRTQWLALLADFGVVDFRWDRGVISEVQFESIGDLAEFIEPLQALLPTVDTVVLKHELKLDDVATLRSLPMQGVRGLRLRRCAIGDDGLKLLQDAPWFLNLHHLDLFHNELTHTGIKTLSGLREFPHLRVLNLCDNQIGRSGIASLCRCRFPQLNELDLNSSGLDGGGLERLAGAECLTGLKVLRLGYCNLHDVKELAESTCLTNLRRLFLEGQQFHSGAAATLMRSPVVANLEEITFYLNRLGPEVAFAIRDSEHLGNLQVLDLMANQIGYEGAEALAEARLSSLRVLSLYRNRITGPGLKKLAHAEALHDVVDLDVAQNVLDDDSVVDLLASPMGTDLSELVLNNNWNLTDASARAVAASQTASVLRNLEMVKTEITEDGERELRETLPDQCEVSFEFDFEADPFDPFREPKPAWAQKAL